MSDTKKGITLAHYPFIMIVVKAYFKPFTNFVSFDLLFEALFLCITFFLAKRSSIEITFDKSGAAVALSVEPLNFLIAFLVVLA
ncbi:hypothetical protein GCM10028826_39060 [Mucilaginibacter boryungensis]